MYYNSSEYVPVDMTPIKPGEYGFTVSGAIEAQSEAGNDMIAIELLVDVPGRDNPLKVFDYLVATPKALFKIQQFCDAVGLDFAANELDADSIIGLAGRAKFVLGAPKQNGNRYLEVRQYLKPAGFTEQPVGAQPQQIVNNNTTPATPLSGDDIPF